MVNPHLPQPATLRCRQIQIESDAVTITVESLAPEGLCPLCGRPSSREHSRYTRRLGDLPWQGRSVRLLLLARKFFCRSPTCRRRIFAERLPSVAAAYARSTTRLADTLSAIAFACGGEAGARLSCRLGMPTSADTLLRMIRRTPIAAPSKLRMLGVDDWAGRKSRRYGTLLCDLQQHRPVDLLDDRAPDTLAAWLREHPEVEIITRDRAHCYAKGASEGAPKAIQVADRFHLMQNLRQALVRMLDRRHPQMGRAMRDAAASRGPPPRPSNSDASNCQRTRRLSRRPTLRELRRKRQHDRYERVLGLHQEGMSHREIARRLHIHRETVGRYIQAGVFPERATRQYASKTEPFTDYLEKRWKEGCRNAAQLARELKIQGFTGSYCSVRRRVAHWDQSSRGSLGENSPQPKVAPPSARRTAWLLLKKPVDLDDRDRAFVDVLLEQNPDVRVAAQRARGFAAMVRREGTETLDSWIQRAWDSAVPRELRTFASSLKSDFDAVNAGLSTAWSNGQLEGQVNRLKLIKRQMYGRANFDLLRQRVLYSG